MADEDEVDVLGDFSLDSLFPKEDSRLHCYDGGVLGAQSSDLLSDYIAPQWLLDASQPWYSADDKSRGTSDRLLPEERQHTFGFSSLSGVESPTKSTPSTSRWEESDLSWTEREKSLIEKGLEMFGKSWNKIAQFIGTKTGTQVKNYVKWERNSRSDESIVTEVNSSSNFDQQTGEVFSFSEIIDDMQIPASMEEVIAVVSTASPTIPISLPRAGESRDRKKDSIKSQTWTGKNVQSKSSYGRKHENQRHFEDKRRREKKKRNTSLTFEDKVKLSPEKFDPETNKKKEGKMKSLSNKHESALTEESKTLPKLPDKLSSGEEVVRITKEGSESDDSEIEVGDNEPVMVDATGEEIDGALPQTANDFSNYCLTSDVIADNPSSAPLSSPLLEIEKKEDKKYDGFKSLGFEDECSGLTSKIAPAVSMKDRKDKNSCHQDIMDNIAAIPPPSEEFFPDMQSISEQEKLIHTEFFEGRSTKTPKRYMKIRNHILECWYNSRPQYVTKTSVRAGLRNCGDVNCIGRIHAYLEQTGAINFGCEQARYLRPHVPTSPTPGVCLIDGEELADVHRGPTREEISARHQARIEAMRPRKRKGMDLASSLEGVDGGYTIIHGGTVDGMEQSDDEIIVFTKANPSYKRSNQSGRMKNASGESKLKLVRCSSYSDEHPAPFALELCLEALLVVDLHAHLMHTEVAGVLGGYMKTHEMADLGAEKGLETLRVCRAVPCRSSGSNIGCDICPVSQTEAMEALDLEGLELVGWYHSHPTFPPLPSLQDMETQAHAQEWFMRSRGSPFLGIILSPHTVQKGSLASSFKCIVVENKQEPREEIPYELDCKIIGLEGSELCLSNLKSVLSVINQQSSSGEVDLDSPAKSPLLQPITLREKILQSATAFISRSQPKPQCNIQEDIIVGLQTLLSQMKNYLSNETT
ncbi:histone H2A deubiquitinase MYSM1-like [Ischnura elegans]|uniref:histone H2A deubiquitinase MYSM1-like n=1 Tax=Ischnura elegans TaxID=197161 RepID=UPI001ED86ED3|nr:histone H2A deubiquitinase MYSM1-like [Ischnura elegans]